ncbi:MAG: DUF3429 domain-containing protein [Gammaproteobacteria bacterium]|nr:DUF3429 domain-containing protein [Gammaproteobacteria bacterium]
MTMYPDRVGVRWGGVSTGARVAGFLGLAPFGLALLCVTVGANQGYLEFGRQLAIAWGAVILTFVAAVHWGLALAGRWQWSLSTIVGSTLPSVIGALAVLLGSERSIALLVAGFGLFWLFEHRTRGAELPGDYLALRRALTLGACTLLVVVAFAAAEATAGSIR